MAQTKPSNFDFRSLYSYANNQADSIKGTSAVYWAARKGLVRVSELLISAKADVNAAITGGHAPIHAAADSGHTRTVRLLLQAKVDINQRFNGHTAAQRAASNDHSETLQLLLNAKAEV